MSDTFLDLYNELMVYVDKGDEQGARKFLVDNFQKFPEETQDKLTFIFFEEALMDTNKKTKDIVEMQKQGLETMSQIDKAKKILEDQRKMEELRSGLTK